jgi:hypothetical protein
MNIEKARVAVEQAEGALDGAVYVVAATFERDGRQLEVAITDQLRRSCRKGKVWKTPAMLTAFKNARYGFDESHARSPGGSDGIFILTRDHQPANPMMKKIFTRFLDRPGSGAAEIAAQLGVAVEQLIPVRLVSHHLRLLGVLLPGRDRDTLVLVDYDDTK